LTAPTRAIIPFLTTALLPLILFDDDTALGMYTSVVCAERGDTDISKVDYSAIDARIAKEARKRRRSGGYDLQKAGRLLCCRAPI